MVIRTVVRGEFAWGEGRHERPGVTWPSTYKIFTKSLRHMVQNRLTYGVMVAISVSVVELILAAPTKSFLITKCEVGSGNPDCL